MIEVEEHRQYGFLNVHIQLCAFSKPGAFPSISLSLVTAPLPAKYTFGELNQYGIMASTHLLCILLDGLLHERSPKPSSFYTRLIPVTQVRRAAPSWPLFGMRRSSLYFNCVSACTQFAGTVSCLLLCGRQSENIELTRFTKRRLRLCNSDSSKKKTEKTKKKVLDGQSPALFIFHQTFSVIKSKAEVRRCAGLRVTGVNGNPCCHLLLRGRILN